jgi:hypothetical protein
VAQKSFNPFVTKDSYACIEFDKMSVELLLVIV